MVTSYLISRFPGKWSPIPQVCAGLLLLIAACCGASGRAHAAKTDEVTLLNGNVLTCEIKELSRGKLSAGTDSMGTVNIEWDEVIAVTSGQNLLLELASGLRIDGSQVRSETPEELWVDTGGELEAVRKIEVVRITPIKRDFLGKLDADVSLGVSFTKSSDVAQITATIDADYRDREYLIFFNLSTIVTTQPSEPTSTRIESALGYRHFLKDRWYTSGFIGAQRNDELGIAFRGFLGLGAGRYLFQTSRSELSTTAGVVGVHERALANDETDNYAAGLIHFEHRFYLYDAPKRELTTKLDIWPSITGPARVRTNFDTRFKEELVADFFWDMQFFVSYDSDPPSGARSDSDYGLITSFGYSL